MKLTGAYMQRNFVDETFLTTWKVVRTAGSRYLKPVALLMMLRRRLNTLQSVLPGGLRFVWTEAITAEKLQLLELVDGVDLIVPRRMMRNTDLIHVLAP
jgi:hypothetical protein